MADAPAGTSGSATEDPDKVRSAAVRLLSLSPFIASFTVYSVLLDHVPESWFTQDWLRYALSVVVALVVGLVLWAVIGRDRPSSRPATGTPATGAAPAPGGAGTATTLLIPGQAVTGGDVRSVADLMDASRRAVLTQLRTENRADGVVLTGWAHHLDSTRGPSAIGTAYGARILALLDVADWRIDRDALLATLLATQREGGGWSARSQRGVSRPESTAWVLAGAATLALDTATRAALVARLEGLLDPVADEAGMTRTSVVTAALSCLTRVAPTSPRVGELTTILLRSSTVLQGDETHAYWRRATTMDGSASPAHTARAVMALARARRLPISTPLRAQAAARVEAGIAWLATQRQLEIFTEALDRPLGDETDLVHIGHFTPAWVARALMLDGARHAGALESAIADVLRHERDGLWRLPKDGTQPIWMTYQGLVALQQHARVTTAAVR